MKIALIVVGTVGAAVAAYLGYKAYQEAKIKQAYKEETGNPEMPNKTAEVEEEASVRQKIGRKLNRKVSGSSSGDWMPGTATMEAMAKRGTVDGEPMSALTKAAFAWAIETGERFGGDYLYQDELANSVVKRYIKETQDYGVYTLPQEDPYAHLTGKEYKTYEYAPTIYSADSDAEIEAKLSIMAESTPKTATSWDTITKNYQDYVRSSTGRTVDKTTAAREISAAGEHMAGQNIGV